MGRITPPQNGTSPVGVGDRIVLERDATVASGDPTYVSGSAVETVGTSVTYGDTGGGAYGFTIVEPGLYVIDTNAAYSAAASVSIQHVPGFGYWGGGFEPPVSSDGRSAAVVLYCEADDIIVIDHTGTDYALAMIRKVG